MNINELNNDCLYLMFCDNFALQELFHLRIICPRWKLIIEKIFLGKQSLKLFVGYDSVREYLINLKSYMLDNAELRLKPIGKRNDDLVLISNAFAPNNISQPLNEIRGSCLKTLFPNVVKLYIGSEHWSPELIGLWPNLTTLAICKFANNFSRQHSLWRVLSELVQLKSLYLFNYPSYDENVNCVCHFINLTSYYDLVLPRLSQFTAISKSHYGFVDLFTCLGAKCVQVTFDEWSCFSSSPYLQRVILDNKESLTHLSLNLSLCHSLNMEEILQKFTSIKSLKISVSLKLDLKI